MISIVLNIIIIGVLSWGVGRFYGGGKLKRFYYSALTLKLLSGFALGALYLLYYKGGDTFVHFRQAELLRSAAFDSWQGFVEIFIQSNYSSIKGFAYTIQPQSAFFCKIIAFLNLFTQGNYWLTGLYFSLFSFVGFWFLAIQIDQQFNRLTALLILFFPSLLFWTSGIMKETLAVGAMVWITALLLRPGSGSSRYWKFLAIIILLLLVFNVKYYYGGLYGAFAFTYVMSTMVRNRLFHGAVTLVSLVLILLLASRLHPNLYFERIAEVIANNYHAYEQISDPEKMVQLNQLDGSPLSLFKNAPKALLNGLFAPLWGAHNPFWILAVIENWFLITLTVISLRIWAIILKFKLTIKSTLAVLFVISMAALLAMSAPNIGTLVRYKTGFMPFFLMLLGGALNYSPLLKKFRGHLLN